MKIINWLVIAKWHVGLGYGVVGIFGMGLVIGKTVQDILFSVGIGVPLKVLYPLGIIGLWLIGYFYDRFGWYSIESSYGCERNEFMGKRFPKSEEHTGDRE